MSKRKYDFEGCDLLYTLLLFHPFMVSVAFQYSNAAFVGDICLFIFDFINHFLVVLASSVNTLFVICFSVCDLVGIFAHYESYFSI